MAKKKGKQRDASGPKPKRLRKQLRKAEARLGKAAAKRHKAQARVEALSIIADEIRAQLADIDKAAAADADTKADTKAAAADADTKAAATKSAPRKTASRKPATTAKDAPKKPTTGTKPATTSTRSSARTPKSD